MAPLILSNASFYELHGDGLVILALQTSPVAQASNSSPDNTGDIRYLIIPISS